MTDSKNKAEQEAAEAQFIGHFVMHEYPGATPSKLIGHGAPDYFLEIEGVVVEIKELIEEEQWAKSAVWERSYQKIRDAIREHPMFPQIRGEYVVVSDYFQLSREKKVKVVAQRFVDAILKEETTFSISGWKFRLGKVEDADRFNISFVGINIAIGSKRSVLGDIILRNVEKAEKQLKECKGISSQINKRVCLLANRFHNVWTNEDFATALSQDIEFYENLSAVDEIWFFNAFSEKLSKPFLIWSRNHTLFLQGNLDKLSIDDLHAWFAPLASSGDAKKEVMFSYLIANPSVVETLFKSWVLRGYLADLIDWAIKFEEKVDRALVFVETLFQMLEAHSVEDAEESGEEGSESLSVAGQFSMRLAFITQKLCDTEELLPTALTYSERLLNHQAKIVREHGMIPFREVARRYTWLDQPRRDLVDKKILELVREPNQSENYQESLGSLLCNCRWLKTEKALELIRLMPEEGAYADPFVVFAIGNMDDETYDYTDAFRRLQSLIREGNSEYAVELSRTVIRRLEDPNIGEAPDDCLVRLHELIENLLDFPCHQGLQQFMSYSFDQYAVVEPERALKWQKKLVEKVIATPDCPCVFYLKNTVVNGIETNLKKVATISKLLTQLPETAYIADREETVQTLQSRNIDGRLNELVSELSEIAGKV